MSDVKEPVVEDLGFDPTLKKKKKKKAPVGDALVGDSTEGDDTEKTTEMDDMFSGLKKKKKKSSTTATKELSAEPVDDLSESLGELKLKKKKKKVAAPAVVDDFEKQLEKAGVLGDESKESTPDVTANAADLATADQAGSATLSYSALLSRFFQILKENNPELAGERSGPKFRIPPPVVQREGTKRTMFANVQEISQVLQRSPEHLIQYLFAELGTSGSIDGQKRLIIKGRFQPKQIETVLRKYVIEYVTCKTCKSMNTELKRESSNRLHFIVCKACGSTRSVSSIKTGFQAALGKRKKAA